MNLIPPSQHDQEISSNLMNIMSEGQPSEKDLEYLLNMSGPGVKIFTEILQSAFNGIRFDSQNEKSETLLILETLVSIIVQLATIAGGCNYVDFSKVQTMQNQINQANEAERGN